MRSPSLSQLQQGFDDDPDGNSLGRILRARGGESQMQRRLHDVPVPSIYGPSADEQVF